MHLTRLNVLLPSSSCITHWGSLQFTYFFERINGIAFSPKNHVCLPALTEQMMFPSASYLMAKSAAFQLHLRLLELCIHSRCSKIEDSSHLLWKHLVVVFMLSCWLPWALHKGIEMIMVYSPSCPSKPVFLPQHAKSDVLNWHSVKFINKTCPLYFKPF